MNTISEQIITALGTELNIVDADSCLTRLRMTLNDNSKINKKALQSFGTVIETPAGVQVILGAGAPEVCKNIKQTLAQRSLITEQICTALGGVQNIKDADACLTRLRITVEDADKLDLTPIKDMGFNILENDNRLQIILGKHAGDIKNNIQKLL